MEFQEFWKQEKRMCKSMNCDFCGLYSDNTNKSILCNTFIMEYPQEAEEIVQKWVDEHPVQTNADKFEEVFGMEVAEDSRICDIRLSDCTYPELNCSECKYGYDWWNKEYKEPERKNNDC